VRVEQKGEVHHWSHDSAEPIVSIAKRDAERAVVNRLIESGKLDPTQDYIAIASVQRPRMPWDVG